jgi:hypothetical protein
MEMDRAHFKETAGATEKDALDRRGRPRKTWRRTREMGKTWREVKAFANQRKRWRSFTGALCSIRV